MDPRLAKLFAIVMICGVAGSLLALLPLIFRKQPGNSGYGTTAGVGFLVGVCLGGLFGVFAVLLGQI
jgi:hypothetical protein